MDIKAINRKMRKIKKTVSCSLKELNEYLWKANHDGLHGQDRLDVENAIRASERLKCISHILSMK